MEIARGLNAVIAFALEIAMLASYGYWGYQTGSETLVKWVFAIGLPVVAIVIWAFFFAPTANWRLSILPGAFLLLGLFLLGAFALI
jgi:hypothetical protein